MFIADPSSIHQPPRVSVALVVLVLEGGCGCATNCGSCDGGCVGEVSASDRGREGVCDGLRSVIMRLALSTWISSGVGLVDVPLSGPIAHRLIVAGRG